MAKEGVEVWYGFEDEDVHPVENGGGFAVDLLACLEHVDLETELPEPLGSSEGCAGFVETGPGARREAVTVWGPGTYAIESADDACCT